MPQRKQFLLPLTAVASALILAGCAGSGGTSLANEDGSSGSDSGVEQTSQGAALATSGAGETVATAGEEIKAVDMPVGGEITSGTGEVLIASSGTFDAFSAALDDGLGSYRTNENFLGDTLAGGAKGFAASGDAVVASGEMVESMNGLPVFMQLDESSGAVTALGGTVSDLGVKITETGNGFAAEIENEDTTAGGGISQLSAVVQPVLVQGEDGVGYVGDALLVGPVASEMLDKSAGLFIQGAGVVGAADPRLSGPEKMMTGGAQMVSGGGRLLTNGGGGGAPLDLDGMKSGPLGGMAMAGDEVVDRVGESVSMLGGAISQVETPMGGAVTSGSGEVLVQAGAGISALDLAGSLDGSMDGSGSFDLGGLSRVVDVDSGSMGSLTDALASVESGQLGDANGGEMASANVLEAPVEQLSGTLSGGQLDAAGLEEIGEDGVDGLPGVVGTLTGGIR